MSDGTPVLTWEEAWPHPYYYQMAKHGWEGDERGWAEMARLWPAIGFAIFFFLARALCKKYIFNSWATALGIRSKSKKAKFGYQFWLLIAYTSSSIYGMSLSDLAWFAWPIGPKESKALWLPHPTGPTIDHRVWFYYWWGTGFYLAELFAIFVETKRSDFAEYVAHHITTILLLTLSAFSDNMRIGVLILLLHDITDVFLCAAKIFHYMNREFWVNTCFVLFLVSFAFLRLWCYPSLIHTSFLTGPALVPGSYGYWICAHLLFVLQFLHVYWFALVLKMVYRLLTGVKGDVRSDDDEEEEARLAAKAKKGEKTPATPYGALSPSEGAGLVHNRHASFNNKNKKNKK